MRNEEIGEPKVRTDFDVSLRIQITVKNFQLEE